MSKNVYFSEHYIDIPDNDLEFGIWISNDYFKDNKYCKIKNLDDIKKKICEFYNLKENEIFNLKKQDDVDIESYEDVLMLKESDDITFEYKKNDIAVESYHLLLTLILCIFYLFAISDMRIVLILTLLT